MPRHIVHQTVGEHCYSISHFNRDKQVKRRERNDTENRIMAAFCFIVLFLRLLFHNYSAESVELNNVTIKVVLNRSLCWYQYNKRTVVKNHFNSISPVMIDLFSLFS